MSNKNIRIINQKNIIANLLDNNKKQCSKCNKILDINMFSKTSKICKECRKRIEKERYENNKQRILQRNKKYYDSHKKQVSEQHKEYRTENHKSISEKQKIFYEENKEIILQRNRKYAKEYYIKFPEKKLDQFLRKRTIRLYKSGKTHDENIGCSSDFLRLWMEYNFQYKNDMSFENHGTYWHLDHVIPISKWDIYNNEEHKRKCFHWTNISPLECTKNISKKNKIDLEQLDEHNRILKLFCEENDIDYNELQIPVDDKTSS